MSFGENIKELVDRSTNNLHAIHASWERVQAGEIASLVNGFAFKSSGFNDQKGMPIVRIRDVVNGVPGTFYRGSIDDPKMIFIENGQIVIGMDGDFNCRIWNGGRSLLNQRVCTLEADAEFYSQSFLAFALPGYLKLINDHTSSVTVKHLSSLTIRDIPLPLPPLNEQHRIVEKIETLFARLDKGEEGLREVQKLLARYRQSVLKAAVTGQLTADWRAENADRLEHGQDLLDRILQTRREQWTGRGKYKEPAAPDTTDLPDLPEGWVWASVEQTVEDFRNGLSKKPILVANEFPILRISATRAMSISLDDLRFYQPSKNENLEPYWVKRGDLLFTRYNGSAHLVGVCGQFRDAHAVLHPDKLIKARPVEMDGLNADFLEVAWNCGVTRQHIARNIKTTSGQQGISGTDIKAAPFPLPSWEEQRKIAELVWDAIDRIKIMQNYCEIELARSTSLRQSILKDAFAGRLVPQDPNDEPATDLLARIKASSDAASTKSRRKVKA
ncbi:MAG: restriction endonuclease subunit S [Rhodospirillales bacterium]